MTTKIVSEIGSNGGRCLPEVIRWAEELSLLVRCALRGDIEASIWAYRLGQHEYLAVDMKGTERGDWSVTFKILGTGATEYDFDNLETNTCFDVPDMTEALSMTAVLLDHIGVTVQLVPMPALKKVEMPEPKTPLEQDLIMEAWHCLEALRAGLNLRNDNLLNTESVQTYSKDATKLEFLIGLAYEDNPGLTKSAKASLFKIKKDAAPVLAAWASQKPEPSRER